jgi:hypothetical protein
VASGRIEIGLIERQIGRTILINSKERLYRKEPMALKRRIWCLVHCYY